ncbi:MAG: fabD [Bacillota bacterium]|jgi:[acyl-carrier-protein] S-malonyltransferase|nr:fabD [Bacillota bacterium]
MLAGKVDRLNVAEHIDKADGAALLFPGQGVQYPGMGKELYDELPEARTILDLACDLLSVDIRKTIFSGAEEELRRTDISQPAIFLVSLMYFEKWKKKNPDTEILAVAGHSLGEFTALCAAGIISFEHALNIVTLRGKLMQDCCSEEQGMLAVLGLEEGPLLALIQASGLEKAVCLANVNAKTQMVTAGLKPGLLELENKLLAQGSAAEDSLTGAKGKWLNVEGAFHSALMKPANDSLLPHLEALAPKNPSCYVVSNADGKPSKDGAEIIGKLKNQMVSKVKWYDTILQIKDLGTKSFYEIGPGDTLKKICMTITFKPKCHSV